MIMTTFASVIGLVVATSSVPGEGLEHVELDVRRDRHRGQDYPGVHPSIIPTTFFLRGAFTGESVLQLFIALLAGFALQQMRDGRAHYVLPRKNLRQALVFASWA